jgi:hypothetical protein
MAPERGTIGGSISNAMGSEVMSQASSAVGLGNSQPTWQESDDEELSNPTPIKEADGCLSILSKQLSST